MKFLHISDLHFDKSNILAITKELQSKFQEYTETHNLVVNEVFFTGDFRNANNQDDSDETVSSVVDFLRSISRCVGVTDDNHIHIVPGNHDLTRSSVEKLEEAYSKYNDGVFQGKTSRLQRTNEI